MGGHHPCHHHDSGHHVARTRLRREEPAACHSPVHRHGRRVVGVRRQEHTGPPTPPTPSERGLVENNPPRRPARLRCCENLSTTFAQSLATTAQHSIQGIRQRRGCCNVRSPPLGCSPAEINAQKDARSQRPAKRLRGAGVKRGTRLGREVFSNL